MKMNKSLKTIFVILLVILVSIISFGGFFVKEKGIMVNKVKDYKLGADLTGTRLASVKIDDSKKTIYYDKDGNVVDSEDKEGSTKEEPVNKEEDLTKENYKKTKDIIEKRLNDLKIEYYTIRQNENNGKLVIELPENDDTNLAVQYMYTGGNFTIEDEETKEVLLDNSNIKNVVAGYNTSQSGTSVILSIEMNKDSVEKLREITNTYTEAKTESENPEETSEAKESTNEEENTEANTETNTETATNETTEETAETAKTKEVSLKMDDTQMGSLSFENEINDGVLSLMIGSTSTDISEINSNLKKANEIAILIRNGKLPLTYTLDENKYVKSDISKDNIEKATIVLAGILGAITILLMIKYKKQGFLIGISNIGYVAILLMAIRYTNVILSMNGLFAIGISIILGLVFNIYLLSKLKKQEEIKKTYNKSVLTMMHIYIPIFIIAVTLSFSSLIQIYSFGQVLFYGIVILFIYSAIITRNVLTNSLKKE